MRLFERIEIKNVLKRGREIYILLFYLRINCYRLLFFHKESFRSFVWPQPNREYIGITQIDDVSIFIDLFCQLSYLNVIIDDDSIAFTFLYLYAGIADIDDFSLFYLLR